MSELGVCRVHFASSVRKVVGNTGYEWMVRAKLYSMVLEVLQLCKGS